MFGVFAVQGDQFVLRCRAAQLLLDLEQHLLELRPIDFLQQAPKGRLAGGRVTPVPTANAQRPPLRLTQLARKFVQIL